MTEAGPCSEAAGLAASSSGKKEMVRDRLVTFEGAALVAAR